VKAELMKLVFMASMFLISFYRVGLTVGRYFARILSIHMLARQ
jgi:hypothetical protein